MHSLAVLTHTVLKDMNRLLLCQCLIIFQNFAYICIKEKDHEIFFGDILWNLILLGLLPPGSSFTYCSEDVNVELTVWAEELRVSSVSPLLRPFPLCLLHCYVNSSEIWSPKRHNLSGYTAGTSNDFIIFFPSLC